MWVTYKPLVTPSSVETPATAEGEFSTRIAETCDQLLAKKKRNKTKAARDWRDKARRERKKQAKHKKKFRRA
jgi:hypothetical protein